MKIKIDRLLNGLITRLEKLENITIEQFPEICKEIVAEGKSLATIHMIIITGPLAILCASAVVGFSYLPFSSLKEKTGCWELFFIPAVASFIAFFPTIYSFFENLDEFIKCKVAPRLYVINKLKEMVRYEQ